MILNNTLRPNTNCNKIQSRWWFRFKGPSIQSLGKSLSHSKNLKNFGVSLLRREEVYPSECKIKKPSRNLIEKVVKMVLWKERRLQKFCRLQLFVFRIGNTNYNTFLSFNQPAIFFSFEKPNIDTVHVIKKSKNRRKSNLFWCFQKMNKFVCIDCFGRHVVLINENYLKTMYVV
jgi:hypothetical protein